jgi:signal transduction histidine kinase/CheY-like chemotaxis protein
MTAYGMWGSISRFGASVRLRDVALRYDMALRRAAALRRALALGPAMALRCGVLVLLVVGYGFSFSPLHRAVGNPAFLVGLVPCIAAAILFGLPGALIVVMVVQLIDRSFALSMPGVETGATAGAIALLSKVLVAGGLGMAIGMRRRVAALNAQLRCELEARKKSEESLRHSEELYRLLVESLGEGVGLFDAQDRVVFANPTLSSTLAVPADQLLGKRFSEYILEETRSPRRVSPDVETAPSPQFASGTSSGHEVVVGANREPSPVPRLAGEGASSYEVALMSNASTVLLVTETRLPVGGPRGALTLRVVRDLTERIVTARRQQELERDLQRSQALQSLAVMAGGVAHDFNNLLCGVMGNAQIAQRKVPPDAPVLLSHCLAEIINFAGEAAQLSKQMLAYAGKRSLAIQALHINGEVTSALRLLHSTVSSRARLVLDLADGLPEVAADGFQLRQVVTNLVLNALDAMDGKRGVLTLRTEHLRLEPEQAKRYSLEPGDHVKVAVEDTGKGIAAEARERLFEPFFSTKAPGRGMGLAAAAGIVRTHRGWLGVDSTSEHGTHFGIVLPIAHESTPRRKSTPAAAIRAVTPRSILIIDDEPAVRVVTARLLNELGHRVMTADNGQRGLELFSEQPHAIDLVVLDLTMPETPGAQILDELRLVRGDVPVVITSGFQAQDASKLLSVPNVIGFLEKPHTLGNLELVLSMLGTRLATAGAA